MPMSSETQTLDFILSVDVEPTRKELRQLVAVLNRALSLLQKMGLPPEFNDMINMIQKAIMTVRMLQFTVAAAYAGMGPIGWAFFLSGIAVTAVSADEIVQDVVS